MKILALFTCLAALASATQLGLYPIPGLQPPAKREVANYLSHLQSIEKKFEDAKGTPELSNSEREALLTAIRLQIDQVKAQQATRPKK